MASIFDDFLAKIGDQWLIIPPLEGDNSANLIAEIAREKIAELTKAQNQSLEPRSLILESDPINFLGNFIAALTTEVPTFLLNPQWSISEQEKARCLINQHLNYALQRNWINIPTGGSSGEMRFAIHTWETLTASVIGFQQYFQVKEINSFCVLPLYHVSGLMQFIRSFTTNGKLVIMPFQDLLAGKNVKINPNNFFISLVPTQLQRLLKNPEMVKILAEFHTILLGGAPPWQELLDDARQYQLRLAPTYGMTETASQIATLKPDDFLAGNNSNGQILPHATVAIIKDEENFGKIKIKSRSLFLGYYPKLWDNLEFIPDDLGDFDCHNYLHIIGRSSDKIITGGENVFPAEIESIIQSSGLVEDICILGIDDREWGQVITAFYVPLDQELDLLNLISLISPQLSKFKRPKHWVKMSHLPRNAQGKINRQQLKIIWQQNNLEKDGLKSQ